jgi:hypothetical protein
MIFLTGNITLLQTIKTDNMVDPKRYLNPDGSYDWTKFDQLTESEQVTIMGQWTHQQRIEYLMRNTISEKECFGPIFKLIDKIEETNSYQSYCSDQQFNIDDYD